MLGFYLLTFSVRPHFLKCFYHFFMLDVRSIHELLKQKQLLEAANAKVLRRPLRLQSFISFIFHFSKLKQKWS